MSYRVNCVSCEYRQDWPTLIDAVADGHLHTERHPLCARPTLVTPQPPPMPAGEHRQRICPSCRSDAIVALGRLFASSSGIRSEYLCRACATAFWLSPDRRLGPHDRRAGS
jgi:hypothetical protein